ncbi:MAG TPA: DUF5131 family protein [Reyranella sp.]|nr:DUF5131 family protein [Reyranella sp.]
MKTPISWTDSTWNPTTGCTKVSSGCDNCYAEALVHRWGADFSKVVEHEKRLSQASQLFTPLRVDGRLVPRRVFVNSMSDLMHEQITDAFKHRCLDAMEANPKTIFQLLTKRPMTLRRIVEERYKASGVPAHIWLGVSVEDNRVRGRVDQLRGLKDSVGPFTAFLSVEPLLGSPDRHDYTAIDQVLIGGESGPKARDMDVAWARTSRDLARQAGAAVWFKQFGKWSNNPLYRESNSPLHIERVRHAINRGEKKAEIVERTTKGPKPKPYLAVDGEKGGATLDGQVLHEYPPHFHQLSRDLAGQLL